MKKAKIKSRWAALTVVLALLGLTVRMDVAYGAIGIETDKKGSMEFEVGAKTYTGPEGSEVDYETLNLGSLAIPVKLYRVASVNVSGKYTALPPYTSLTGLGSVDAGTNAGTWASFADAAHAIAEPLPDAEGNTPEGDKPYKELTLENAHGRAENLETGLYLVSAQEVVTAEYIYSFQPYLVSLPGNACDASDPDSSDDWLYDVTVGLKPSRENRYGDLEIRKTLDTYNATLGGAAFIFEISAEKDGIVYNDVVSVVFDGAGTKSVKIEGRIPAGALVTVKEIYSGASYEAVAGTEKTETIIADQLVSVTFRNDYDERLNGGTSIVNHFAADKDDSQADQGTGAGQSTPAAESREVWSVVQQKDSTGQTGEE